MRDGRGWVLAWALAAAASVAVRAETRVGFAADGTCLVNGRPFFPIGVWVYNLNPDVVADLHEHRFNTVVGSGVAPGDLPLIEKHKLMAIPMGTDAWVAAAKKSDSLLAWYLMDEPEEHNVSPEETRRAYDALKAKDADHPIGITHNQLAGPPKYKGSSDFTMTDVYPVTRKRDWPLKAVGAYTDGPREVHGRGWPNFTFVQTFGGPDTDGGLWAQPLPHEVRFMAYDALVHRANGILYFSYWPRSPVTWASVAGLNREIERLVPWLLAPGEEVTAKADGDGVEVRARKLKSGGAWLVIAINTTGEERRATISVEGIAEGPVRMPFDNRVVKVAGGKWAERFAPYEEHVYVAGEEPEWP